MIYLMAKLKQINPITVYIIHFSHSTSYYIYLFELILQISYNFISESPDFNYQPSATDGQSHSKFFIWFTLNYFIESFHS